MAIVDLGREAKMIEIRGKLGRPNGFGNIQFGWSVFGDYCEFAGYYQRRPRKKGQLIVKMRHYTCPNRQTENQQIWRAIFAGGVEDWHALTTEEKQYYNKLKSPARQSGFTRFMSRYLAQNYPPV